jgi:hypothetical protein
MNGPIGMGGFASSAEALSYLQRKYGTANFREWQTLRFEFWSFQDYTAAGLISYNFFSTTAAGAITTFDTNMPKANSFGQVHFLIKAIHTRWSIANWDLTAWDGTDATTLVSDMIDGFCQAGYLRWTINNREFALIPKPFLYAPAADGQEWHRNRVIDAITLTEGTPNTLATLRSAPPYATLGRRENAYLMDPNILVEAEQNFNININFDRGVVPIIATTINNDTTNPLKIGVKLDGILFRPMQ